MNFFGDIAVLETGRYPMTTTSCLEKMWNLNQSYVDILHAYHPKLYNSSHDDKICDH